MTTIKSEKFMKYLFSIFLIFSTILIKYIYINSSIVLRLN